MRGWFTAASLDVVYGSVAMRASYLRRCQDWPDVGETLLHHITMLVRLELEKPVGEAAAALLFLPVKIAWQGTGYEFQSDVVSNPHASECVDGAALVQLYAEPGVPDRGAHEALVKLAAHVRRAPLPSNGILRLE